MKKLVLVTLLIFAQRLLIAQPYHIEGIVRDSETKKGLPNALVFINQTLQSTFTDSLGQYTFDSVPYKSFIIVVSLKGYEFIAYTATPLKEKSSIKFELIKFKKTISDYNKKDWDKWSFTFLYNLLGGTKNAAECEILNPEAVRFSYNEKEDELSVTTEGPLQIINEGLGYSIFYQLDSFVVDPRQKDRIFNGYCCFRTLTSKKQELINKWIERRQQAYNGSINHFFKSVYNNSLEKEGFEVHTVKRVFEGEPDYNLGKKQKGYTVFNKGSMVDGGVTKNFMYLIDKTNLNIDSIRKIDANTNNCFFYHGGVLQVIYKNEMEDVQYLLQTSIPGEPTVQTSFLICQNPLLVQPSGMYLDISDLSAIGYMRWEKLGELLPLEAMHQ